MTKIHSVLTESVDSIDNALNKRKDQEIYKVYRT